MLVEEDQCTGLILDWRSHLGVQGLVELLAHHKITVMLFSFKSACELLLHLG